MSNAIHVWNMFRNSLGKKSWYVNHFSLPDEQREFIGDLSDTDL